MKHLIPLQKFFPYRSHLSYEERLQELGLFSLENTTSPHGDTADWKSSCVNRIVTVMAYIYYTERIQRLTCSSRGK